MLSAFTLSALTSFSAPAAPMARTRANATSGAALAHPMDTEAEFLDDINFHIGIIRAIVSHPEIPGDMAVLHFKTIRDDAFKARQTADFQELETESRDERHVAYKRLVLAADHGTRLAERGGDLREALAGVSEARTLLGY